MSANPTASSHDVRADVGALDVAVAPADRLELVAVERVDHVGDAREQLRRRPPRTCARRRRTGRCAASGASMFERSSAISASATRRDRLADRAHELQHVVARRRTPSSVADELEHLDVAGPEAAFERARIGEARPRARSRARTSGSMPGLARRPRRASTARRRGAGCGTRRSSAARPPRGLHELGDRRADLVGEVGRAARAASAASGASGS